MEARPRWLQWPQRCCWLLVLLCALRVHSEDPILDVKLDKIKCKDDAGRQGICVRPFECEEQNYTISVQIPLSALRDSDSPASCGPGYWCCRFANQTESAAGRDSCGARVEKECPWCVALYRPGGDVSRNHRSKTGMYCAGVLVGQRVVLTSATCVRAPGGEATWAYLPASELPDKRYNITERIMHDNYSTATHQNDFGLLVLHEDVKLGFLISSINDACISLQTPLDGECVAAGFTEKEELVITVVTVRSGRCTRRYPKHMISDDACGTVSETPCPVVPGAPVFCPTSADGQGGLVIAGVARQNCIKGTVLLGKLQQHASWLLLQLKLIGL